MILAFPFDNTEYRADALGAWFSTRTRGVFCVDDNLRVVANNDVTVTVKKGIAWLKMRDDWGIVFNNTADLTLTVTPPNTSSAVQIAVVCQIDKLTPNAGLVLRAQSGSSAPMPIRDSLYDEIIIAYILASSTTTSITAAEITDTRLNEALCGLMRDGVTQIPTSALQEQAQQLLSTLQTELSRLNAGTEAMMKTTYDPKNRGYVDKAETANSATNAANAERLQGYDIAVGSVYPNGKIPVVDANGMLSIGRILDWFALNVPGAPSIRWLVTAEGIANGYVDGTIKTSVETYYWGVLNGRAAFKNTRSDPKTYVLGSDGGNPADVYMVPTSSFAFRPVKVPVTGGLFALPNGFAVYPEVNYFVAAAFGENDTQVPFVAYTNMGSVYGYGFKGNIWSDSVPIVSVVLARVK